jgi:hypothetical protein
MPGISVATLNLLNRQNRWLARRELIVAEFIDTQPDLISLQEIYLPIGQARWLKNQINSRLSGRTDGPYQLFKKRRQHPVRGIIEGIGILSRLPVELETRETLDFVAVHLHHMSQDREARLEQVMLLTGWLNDKDSVPLQVIAGDFNEVPGGLAIEYMKQSYRSVFVEYQGYDPIATFPTALIQRSDGWSGCLDYIFISKAVNQVLNAQIFCRKPSVNDPTLYASDHVGLLANIEVGSSDWIASGRRTKAPMPKAET